MTKLYSYRMLQSCRSYSTFSLASDFSPWRDEQSAQVAEPWHWIILDHTRMRHKIPPVCPNSLFVLSAFLWPLLASQVALFSLDESHRGAWVAELSGVGTGTAKHESTVVAQDWVQAQRPFQPQLLLLPSECATTEPQKRWRLKRCPIAWLDNLSERALHHWVWKCLKNDVWFKHAEIMVSDGCTNGFPSGIWNAWGKENNYLFNLYRHRPTHSFTTPQACWTRVSWASDVEGSTDTLCATFQGLNTKLNQSIWNGISRSHV